MVGELVHFVQDLFLSCADNLYAVDEGNGAAVIGVLDYVRRVDDAEEEGFWGK